MNWYFEHDGVSQGPLLEHDLAGRVQRGEIAGTTLIWHEGMNEWRPVAEVSPDWGKPKPVAPAVKPAAAKVSPTTKPLAPSKQTTAYAGKPSPKQGFFSRLFGAGKKKN
jgi:hypothetical protein